MRSLATRTLVTLLITLGLTAALGWQLQSPSSRAGSGARFAMPTEHRLDSDAERQNRKGRKEWMEELHRAAPGTDWRAIEQANGQTLEALRAAAGGRTDSWTEIGSRNQAGRMHCAAISVDGDSLYSGSDRGGLWKADLDGNGWHPLSDNLWGGVHLGVAAAGSDPEVVSILSASAVIRYSEDQGENWLLPAGLPAVPQQGKRLLRDPANPDRVYLLLSSQGQGIELYRSEDAGRSYTLLNHTNNGIADFWMDRVSGGDLYLMVSKRLFRSTDDGANWIQVGELPFNPAKLILAGSEDGAPTFYVAAKNAGNWELWRSTDAGVNWSFRSNISDFWETMNCSITDDQIVLTCGVEAWRSVNGGSSFIKVNSWGAYYGDPLNKLHADNPGLEVFWHPTEGELFFPCTDGGIYRSDDIMASVVNLSMSGLGVSQYYDVHTSIHDPYRIAAGAQDQGYQRSDGRGPIVDFDQLISGDYAHLTSSDGSHLIVFSVYPGFTLVHHGEFGVALHYLDFPVNSSHLWLPPIVADPLDSQAHYFCGKYLYRGHWSGGDNVSYTNNPQDFTVHGGSYLSAFAISPIDLDRRMAVTNSGEIWYSHDGGTVWTHSTDDGPSGHYFHGNSIVFSGSDPNRAWLSGSGYSGPAVYTTADGGVSWTPMGDGLPSTLVYMLTTESPASDALYAASESGPYRYDTDNQTWLYIGGNEAPLTTYWSVEAVPAIGVVRFGTYGRGIWDFDVSGLTAVAELPAASPLALTNYPNPFNPATTLSFDLPAASRVRLDIHDAAGRRVRSILDEERAAGEQSLSWRGKDDQGRTLPSGVYFARISAAGFTESRRLVLIK
jgi:photosystem II stability/assembly factor-like uncharacterized protein